MNNVIFPNEKSIDDTNSLCFDNIAHEFDDHEHATCRNFDVCTEEFLSFLVNTSQLPKQLHYLDIGVGTGKSLEAKINGSARFIDFLGTLSSSIDVLDISGKMIEETEQKFSGLIANKYESSVFKFSPNNKYNLIVASMCAPYLTKNFLRNAYSILENNGFFLLSYPSGNYIDKTRSSRSKTSFRDKLGRVWTSYSFHWDTIELLRTLKKTGFNIVFLRSISLSDLCLMTTLSPRSEIVLKESGDCSFCDCILVQKRTK